MKPRVLIAGLGGCSGCIASLFSMDVLGPILDKFNLIYFPLILDNGSIKACDIALIEGAVITSEHVEFLKSVREVATRVMALGTCACFGGVTSMSADVEASPLSAVIEVDVAMPGCPPPPGLLSEATMQVMSGRKVVLPERNACATCELRGEDMADIALVIDTLVPPVLDLVKGMKDESRTCFLKRGILCLGPVTREGCETRCIKKGVPCEGCMGPVPPARYAPAVLDFFSTIPMKPELRRYQGYLTRFSKPRVPGVHGRER